MGSYFFLSFLPSYLVPFLHINAFYRIECY